MKKSGKIIRLFKVAALLFFYATVARAQEIKIGTQIWTTQNLDVSVFRNGDSIPHAKTGAEWWAAGNNGKPAWCYYNNDPVMGRIYGKLYNWHAVNDPRGLAPAGWHVPSDKEWTILVNYLGGDSVAGEKMKNITGWNDSYGSGGPYAKDAQLISGDGTNESGFAALPAGERNYGMFAFLGKSCYFWSSTEWGYGRKDEPFAYYRILVSANSYVHSANVRKWEGYSVRCVKD